MRRRGTEFVNAIHGPAVLRLGKDFYHPYWAVPSGPLTAVKQQSPTLINRIA